MFDQLQGASDENKPSLFLGWRAVVSLLLSHIQLHGLQQSEQAANSYKRVLEGDVDVTITALAKQVLQRCQSEDIASGAGTTPSTTGAIPDLLEDPFVSTDPDQARPAPADVVTAMPWLSSEEEPRAMQSPDPSPTATPVPDPVPSPEPTLSPEANSDVEVEVEIANQEPARSEEEPPLETIEPKPQEPAAKKLLEHSWLRVQLSPTPKAPPTPWSRWG